MYKDREKNFAIQKDIEHLQSELIGDRFKGASLSSIHSGQHVDQVIEWLKNNKNFLVYLGNPGCGKTYFCSSLIPWIHLKLRTYRYWKESDLMKKLRGGISDIKGSYLQTLEYMIDHQMVMYDDMGSTDMTEWRKEIISELINNRYESQKPTVITSNMTREEIQNQFGKRIYSRIFSKENTILEFHDSADLRQVNFPK